MGDLEHIFPLLLCTFVTPSSQVTPLYGTHILQGIYFGVDMQFCWGICLCYIVILLFIVCPCVFNYQLSWLHFILVVAVDFFKKHESVIYLFQKCHILEYVKTNSTVSGIMKDWDYIFLSRTFQPDWLRYVLDIYTQNILKNAL